MAKIGKPVLIVLIAVFVALGSIVLGVQLYVFIASMLAVAIILVRAARRSGLFLENGDGGRK